ncbi:nuclear transport factor 2 family protein [Arenimonas aestuarii]
MPNSVLNRLFPLSLLVFSGLVAAHETPAAAMESGGLAEGPLFDELAEMDRRIFEASFVTCDAEVVNAIFSDDVEFYHDKAGFSGGEQVRENTRNLAKSCPAKQGITRTVVPGSLRIYPIEGYGATQVGVHRFDEKGAPTSTLARFVHVWQRQEDGSWRLPRVLSLDHVTVPADAQQMPATEGDTP